MEGEWLEEALLDLKEIGQIIAADDPQAACRGLSKIETTPHSLERHPQLGRPGGGPKTRELVIPGLPFIIAYYTWRNKIRILALMHTFRKWPNDFQIFNNWYFLGPVLPLTSKPTSSPDLLLRRPRRDWQG